MAGHAANPLHAMLHAPVDAAPESPALLGPDGGATSHAALHGSAQRVADALAHHDVGPTDRVVVQLPPSAAALALHLACVRLGAVHVPIDLACTDSEVAALVDDCEPVLVVRPDTVARLLETTDVPASPVAHRTLDDPAAMLYTSGTTGRPKGVVLTQRNLIANARNLTAAWGFTPDDVLVHALPLSHTHGLFVAAYCVLTSGASMHLLPRFDARAVLDLLPGSTVLMGVPTHYVRLLELPGFDRTTTSGMRLFTSGSAPLLATTHHAVRERTGHAVLERYGMTEACILTSNPLAGDRRAGTVGRPLPGVELRLVAEDGTTLTEAGVVGAIQVRGDTVFTAYWRRPGVREAELTADGWFRTGDLGRLDEHGYLEIVGRSRDLVISGGLNVHPKEVETVLDAVPGVAESSVIGLPDADLGERVVAAVVAEPGVRLDPEAVRAACRVVLAGYKVPKEVVVVPTLPRNTMGKVEKSRLRADLAARAS